MTPTLWALFVSAIFGLPSWWIWRIGRRRQGALIAAIGAALAVYAYIVDKQQRATTLAEALLEGTLAIAPGQPAPRREHRFTIEHPGVPHRLLVHPVKRWNHPASFDALIHVTLRDEDANRTIVDREYLFQPEFLRNSRQWSSITVPFTPDRASRYSLVLVPITTGIPDIHIRVEDPQKTNGVRIPGW